MSATFSADNGASALEMQLKHNWKNPSMALEYINNSKPHREKMAGKIQSKECTTEKRNPAATITSSELENSTTSNSLEINESEPVTKKSKTESEEKNVMSSMFDIGKFSNCTVNINVQK